MNNNIYPNLGKNIKALRKAFGKSQSDLVNDLATAGEDNKRFDDDYQFITKQAISQYENGARIPERKYLNLIAKYFKITVDELLYGDFTNLKFNIENKVNPEISKEYFDSLCPIIFTDEALLNQDFKTAYELQKKLYDNIKKQTDDFGEYNVDEFKELYKKAYKEQHIIESIYNLLSWDFFEDMITSIMTPSNMEKFENGNFSAKECAEIIFLNKPEFEKDDYEKNVVFQKEYNEFIKNKEIDFYAYISILKKHNKYNDFVDYYIALRYTFGLFSDNTYEINRLIGTSLLNTYDILGNKYIKKFKAITKTDS